MLLLVIVALAPPTVVAVYSELQERHEARLHAQQDVFDTARLVRADVQRVFTGTARFLGALTRDVAAQPEPRCERLVALVPRATSRYSSVGVARPDGTVYCGATRSGVIRQRVDVSRAPWFRDASSTTGFVLGELGPDPVSGTQALAAAQAVPGPPGHAHRIMFAAIDVSTLTQATALRDVPRATTFVLFDRRGTVLAQVPASPGAVGRPADGELLAAVMERRRGTAEVVGPSGTSQIQGFAPVGGPVGDRLFISAGRATSTVFADPNEDLQRFFVLSALGLVLALAFAYLVTRLLLQRWTSEIVEAARRFGAGDLTARASVPRGFGELSDVANALNSAAEDIERRQREQAHLLAELVAVEEETRRRIAADIHDDTAQAVAAAGLRMDALVAGLKDPVARETASKARQGLGEANRRLRRLLFELRPPALDRAGLAPALELFLTDAFSSNGFDWRVESALDAEPSPEIRAVLYRVALEALTNVRKHADARTVHVALERRGVGVAVQVRDDGRGFDVASPEAAPQAGHIGLVSMRERAEAAGGRLTLTSAPGEGTTVDFWMPEPNGRP